MYQFRLSKIGSTLEPASDLVAALTLCLALLGIGAASILFVVVEQEISSTAATCGRLGVAAIAFGVWSSFQQTSKLWSKEQFESHAYTWRDLGLLLVAGVSFAASLALWAWSLTQTSVANSTLLNNLIPIFTTLGAWLLVGQRFKAKFLLGMGVAVAGAIALGIEDLQAAESHVTGDVAALLSAMLSATSILSIEQLRVKFSAPVIMLWTSLIGSLCILPISLVSEGPLFPTSWVGWSAVIFLGLISQVMGQGLLTYSLKRFSAGLVAVLMLVIPVIAAILAMLIFSEQLSLLNWLAFSVVLVGIYLAISAQSTQNIDQEVLLEN